MDIAYRDVHMLMGLRFFFRYCRFLRRSEMLTVPRQRLCYNVHYFLTYMLNATCDNSSSQNSARDLALLTGLLLWSVTSIALFFDLKGLRGLVVMVAAPLLFWLMLRLIDECRFDNKLAETLPHGRSRLFRMLFDRRTRHWIGGDQLLAQEQQNVVFVALLIILLATVRALNIKSSAEFANAGALVAIAGLWSTVIALKEVRAIHSRREALLMSAGPKLQDELSKQSDLQLDEANGGR